MITMANSKGFMDDLTGKRVLIKTQGGAGTKDARLAAGEYQGVLLGFDGDFIELQYETKRFTAGTGTTTKEIIFINVAFIISVNELEKET